MNDFKKSDKRSHNYYSNHSAGKDFITDREFIQDGSLGSSDLNLSFNSFESSFFSESSEKPEEMFMKVPISQPIQKKLKEEETDYTAKASPVVLEKEEFKKSWFCNSCVANNPNKCTSLCLIF